MQQIQRWLAGIKEPREVSERCGATKKVKKANDSNDLSKKLNI